MFRIEWVEIHEEEFLSLEHFYLLHPDKIIASVDGLEVVGECEICGKLVFEQQARLEDSDGIITHLECETKEEAFQC